MLSKNQIKFINSLKVNKFRKLHNAFIVEGRKNVEELLGSRFKIKTIISTVDWLTENSQLIPNQTEKILVMESDLKKISDFITPDRVIAVAEIPEDNLLPDYNRNILVLDGIRDPGNLGTIIRTADWFGFRQIVCSDDTVDFYNPKVIQATMGSFTRVQTVYTQLFDFLMNKPENIVVYGAVLGGNNLNEKTFSSTGLLIIGSESHGIRENLIPLINVKVTIPSIKSDSVLNGTAESLNASVAAAILCYEMGKMNL